MARTYRQLYRAHNIEMTFIYSDVWAMEYYGHERPTIDTYMVKCSDMTCMAAAVAVDANDDNIVYLTCTFYEYRRNYYPMITLLRPSPCTTQNGRRCQCTCNITFYEYRYNKYDPLPHDIKNCPPCMH